MSVSATARFTVTIDVPLGSWSEKCNFENMREQWRKEGANKLRNDLAKIDYTIVGQPKLKATMAEETRP